MRHAQFRMRRNKQLSADAGTSTQPIPQVPAPLRAKIEEYFRELPSSDPSSQNTYNESSSCVQGSQSKETLHPETAYRLWPPYQKPDDNPPSLSQYPLAVSKRPHILPSRKGIQLAPQFRILGEPLTFCPDSSDEPHSQPETSNANVLKHRENIQLSLSRIGTPNSQTPVPVGSKQTRNYKILDKVDAPMKPSSLRVSGQVICATRETKIIEFNCSSPIKKNAPGIRINNLTPPMCAVDCTTGITLAVSHFLAYATASQPIGQGTRLVYLESRSGRFSTSLMLPATFGRNDFIIDMASMGDYLAVTTNEGGALVWEIPELVGEHYFLPTVRLQVLPTSPGLKKVRWHSSGKIAFASNNQVFLVDLNEVKATFCGLPVYLDKLKQVAKVFEVISPIASFAFDYKTNSIAILSFSGAICFFVIHGDYPIWKASIRGHGDPSSLDIYDWGMLIGWKNGTILQLFASQSTSIISTLQFTHGVDPASETRGSTQTDTCFDDQHRILWVAHSARASLLAVRIPIRLDNPIPDDTHIDTYQVFEQIFEVPIPLPVVRISLVIPNDNNLDRPVAVKVYTANASGAACVTITRKALESANTMMGLTFGAALQEQPRTKDLNPSQQELLPGNDNIPAGEEPAASNQTAASVPHPVRVNRDTKKNIGAHELAQRVVELDVSKQWDSAQAKTDCITITPLAQLTASSVSSKPPALFNFDHSHAPGPIYTVNAFLAYGASNGRIGLVFRHNGVRALLKLPARYGRNALVIDLDIIGQYLACITDSGGAVVWKVPNTYSRRKGTLLSPLIQIQPSGLRRVKWHHGGKLALLSDSEVCLFDVRQLQAMFEGLFVPWKNLMQLAQRYPIASFIANFTFDTRNKTLAILSVDSILSLWDLETRRMTWQGKVLGDGDPSSIDIVDNAVIIGRNRGNTLQLLVPGSTNVLSTFQFMQPLKPHNRQPLDLTSQPGARMYAQFCYDSRLRTLWMVHSNRMSLIAVRFSIVLDNLEGNTGEVHGVFEKIAEFPTPVPIDGVISLFNGDTKGPSLAVATIVSQEMRIDLLTINENMFEASLRPLSAKPLPESKLEAPQGTFPSLKGDELQQILDAMKSLESGYQTASLPSVPSNMESNSSKSGINSNRPIDIARPTEMSTEEMFECLIRHGCPNLTQSINPDAYSRGFMAAGGFGDIWKGELFDGTAVAIKVWRFRTVNEDPGKDVKRAMREIYNWSKLDHDNVNKLLGVIVFDGRLGMVSKWMENGNLQHYLQKNPQVDRYQLCTQVAQGVKYLHDKNIIHGDLKAINILVSSECTLKLTDFDHSIITECTLQFSETTRGGGGTLRWMAPELVLDSEATHQRNKRTDIYALGMTFLETITGTVPYSQQCRADFNVYRTLTKKEYPRRDPEFFGPDQRGDRMWALLMRCWDHDPTARPTASKVTTLLQTLIRETEPHNTA